MRGRDLIRRILPLVFVFFSGPVSLVLEDETLTEDIEFLRYVGHGNGGGGGGGGSNSGYGGYGDPMATGVSGRSRRPPAWRRDD